MNNSLLRPAPLAQTAAGLRSGQTDLLGYINRLCDHIDAVEPKVQALLPEPDRRARLLSEAQELLRRYPEANERPILFGIPIGVKDIFQADGFETRAGSKLPPAALAGPEADSVALLRAAGALVLGKTVTTEFAFFEPGPTRNPHNLAHTPGGSSSGSAAAVAAGITPLALGTQTIGSVIRPAAFCGIVGFKPTYNRIPPEGLLFFSRSADHVGLFTQDVAGMQLAASVTCADWQPYLAAGKPVLGVPAGPYLAQASDEALAAFEEQVMRLAGAGYVVIRQPLFPDIDEINRRHRALIAYEFAQEQAQWFAEYEDLYRPRTAALIREGQQVDPAEAADIRDMQPVLREEVEHVMDVHDIDLWICPAAPGPAPEGIGSTGDPVMNLPWTYLGLPAVTLPAGFTRNGLPLGLQMVGKWMEDEKLLGWAEKIETEMGR
ncbi:MAG TPA: amidase [Caldilineae bacterium]|nr:amidase [Caldilineae bacterium]